MTELIDEHFWIRVHAALASQHALLLEESYVRGAARWHRITPKNLNTVRAGLRPRALLTVWPDLNPNVGAVKTCRVLNRSYGKRERLAQTIDAAASLASDRAVRRRSPTPQRPGQQVLSSLSGPS
ncbi:hypothetical protein ACGFZK_14260 [Streptomyces sp. NPDC048257]|uniref:hypothetical protein n=1 Tax=Streptomyces sp. NPDC048257 TaxID=3365526 RepID=UPI003710A3F8